jgi:hypothetical protein
LESGLDAIIVAHRRLVYRWYSHAYADAHSDAYAWSHTNADSDSDSDSDSDAHSDSDSRPGMRRGSNLDRDRDLYGRPAGATERRSL